MLATREATDALTDLLTDAMRDPALVGVLADALEDAGRDRDAEDVRYVHVKPTGCHVRWAIRRDMPEILGISRATEMQPLTEASFLRMMRTLNVIGMVLESPPSQEMADTPIYGYMVYELNETHLRVLEFGVHPDFRHRGFASKMMARLVAKLSSHRRTRILIEPQDGVCPEVFRLLGCHVDEATGLLTWLAF